MKLKKWFGTALSASVLSFGAHATIIADIVWVVDTSGSMGDDIAQVKQRIQEFDTVMQTNGVDARYALVRFGGTSSLIQDITTFATFTAAGSPFQLLTDNGGGTEDGSEAIQTALTASFRANTVQNIILVTDENDDNTANRSALQTALDGTVNVNELINIIGNPSDDDNNYYRTLAPANGGAFFDINSFRADPAPFFTNFINTKVKEIVDDFCTRNPTDPQCTGTLPTPSIVWLFGLGLVAMSGRAYQARVTRR